MTELHMLKSDILLKLSYARQRQLRGSTADYNFADGSGFNRDEIIGAAARYVIFHYTF
jgi:hypothetical protein